MFRKSKCDGDLQNLKTDVPGNVSSWLKAVELGTPPIRRLSVPKRSLKVGFLTDKADSITPGYVRNPPAR